MLPALSTINGPSIVLLGNFNPKIFQPYWFAAKKLIREEEGTNAKINIIHDSIVQFQLDWATFSIEQDKFYISATNESYFEAVKDLIISTFDILKETPIWALGINHTYSFKLDKEDYYKKFGEWLYNYQIWKSNIEEGGGLITLEVFRPKKENGEYGTQRIRVTPSDTQRFEVSIDFNNHIQTDVQSTKKVSSAKNIISMLEKNWKPTSINTKSIVNDIWQQFCKTL